jgi:hypothetical protein
MNLLYEPSDPYMYETLLHIVRNAIEGPYSNARVQAGIVTLSCTQNVLASQQISFTKPFKKGVTPTLFLFPNPTVTNSTVKPSYANLTNSGFTAQVYSDTTQSVTVNYLAIGQVGGA